MNVALNQLPTQPASTKVSSSKSSVSSTKSQSKNSFSDTLNKAVSQSDEPTVNEQEQVSAEDSMNSPVTKKNDTAAAQDHSATDAAEVDAITAEENAMPSQDELSNIANALAMQIPLAVPTATMSIPNEQLVAAQQSTAAIPAIVNLPELSPKVQTETVSTLVNDSGSNNQSNQNQNLVQTGQAAPELLDKLAGSITEVVTGNTTQATTTMQNQAADVEAALKPNTTLMSQLTVSMQEQTANTGAFQNLNKATVTQQSVTVTTPNPVVNAEAATTTAAAKEQLPEQIAIPTVETNQQHGSLSSNLSDQGQQESLTDADTLKVAQDLPSKGVDVSNSAMFAQHLDATLSTTVTVAKTAVTQPQTTPDVYQVVDQIVEQTKIITKLQNTEMVMKLKPEHLGELTLKVAVENGVVNASFHSNNPEVRSLIEASLPQLKQELANTGLKVDNVSVYAGLGQFQPNQEQDRNAQQQLKRFTSKKIAGDFIEAIEGEMPGSNFAATGSQSGVDYRI